MVAKTNYLATDAQVATLTREHVQNAQGAATGQETFLRILLAHSLRELSKGQHKRHSAAEALASVETAYAHLYAIVLEAVTTPDLTADNPDLDKAEKRRRAQERNRRSGFARSSKSELATFVKLGGRLVTLEPATVTRDILRAFIKSARAGPASAPERVEAAATRLENVLRELAAEDLSAAKDALDDLRHRLQAVVTPPKRMTGTRRVGDITLRAEA